MDRGIRLVGLGWEGGFTSCPHFPELCLRAEHSENMIYHPEACTAAVEAAAAASVLQLQTIDHSDADHQVSGK